MPDLRDITARILRDILSAFGLLTRLPLPDHQTSGAGSAWAWPLVGAGLGGLAALMAGLGMWLGLTPGVVAVLVLALGAAMTGGLHEDGLSDTADGLFGGWTPAVPRRFQHSSALALSRCENKWQGPVFGGLGTRPEIRETG